MEKQSVSVMRIFAYSLDRLWVLIIFYSVMFYTGASTIDERLNLLYTNLSISMAAMAGALLLSAIIFKLLSKIGFRPIFCRPLIYVSSIVMAIGSLLLILSNISNINGILLLVTSGILTGVGSACLIHCFFDSFSLLGTKIATLEISLGTCIALFLGLLLLIAPAIVARIAIIIIPIASAILLDKSPKSYDKELNIKHATTPKAAFSKKTQLLIGKIFIGALFIGAIEGFFDSFFGNCEESVTFMYGALLFISAFVVVCIIVLIAASAKHNVLFSIYKISLILFFATCALSIILGKTWTYTAAIFFAGYMSFCVLLTCICVEISNNYETNPSLTYSFAFFLMYVGEFIGVGANNMFSTSTTSDNAFLICCVVATSLIFITSTFLFTDIDLVTIGIGEIRPFLHEAESSASVFASANANKHAQNIDYEEVAKRISKDFHLSARESEVLPLLLSGRTIARIQESLFISAGTVSTHIRHIYQKTGVERKQELLDLGEDYAKGNIKAQDEQGEQKA